MPASSVSSELLREIIREVIRDVLQEVVAEEVEAAMRQPGHKAPSTRVSASPSRAETNTHFLSRGALTERHVRAAEAEMASITVTKKVVVTPLARERAKSSGIQIIRIED